MLFLRFLNIATDYISLRGAMSRISGLRNDMNKRTFYKERKINNRFFEPFSETKTDVSTTYSNSKSNKAILVLVCVTEQHYVSIFFTRLCANLCFGFYYNGSLVTNQQKYNFSAVFASFLFAVWFCIYAQLIILKFQDSVYRKKQRFAHRP